MDIESAITILSNLRLPQRLTFVSKEEIDAVEFAIEELKKRYKDKASTTFDNSINIKI